MRLYSSTEELQSLDYFSRYFILSGVLRPVVDLVG